MHADDADEGSSYVQLSISFILITVDNGLMTTPLCGTFFDQQEQLASNGGMAVRSFIRVLCCERSDRWLSQGMLGISCFESASAAPWTDRGLWALGSEIVAGLVIDLIFVNLSRELSPISVLCAEHCKHKRSVCRRAGSHSALQIG